MGLLTTPHLHHSLFFKIIRQKICRVPDLFYLSVSVNLLLLCRHKILCQECIILGDFVRTDELPSPLVERELENQIEIEKTVIIFVLTKPKGKNLTDDT